MSYHDCKIYEPDNADKGATYKCMCGCEYTLVRRWPWRKWKLTNKK